MPLTVQLRKKESQVETLRFKLDKTKVLLEATREQLDKATEACREVAETLERQTGRMEEWQEESRGLRGRMEAEEEGEKSDQESKAAEEKGELEKLLEAAQKGNPNIMQDLLEQLRKAVEEAPKGAGGGWRRPARAKGEDGEADGSRGLPRRSRSPLRARALSN